METGIYLTMDISFVGRGFSINEAFHRCSKDTRITCPQPNRGDLYRIMSPVFMYEDGNEKALEKAKKTAKDFCHYACHKFFSSIEQSAKMWKRFYKTRKKTPTVYVIQDGHLVEEPVK